MTDKNQLYTNLFLIKQNLIAMLFNLQFQIMKSISILQSSKYMIEIRREIV